VDAQKALAWNLKERRKVDYRFVCDLPQHLIGNHICCADAPTAPLVTWGIECHFAWLGNSGHLMVSYRGACFQLLRFRSLGLRRHPAPMGFTKSIAIIHILISSPAPFEG